MNCICLGTRSLSAFPVRPVCGTSLLSIAPPGVGPRQGRASRAAPFPKPPAALLPVLNKTASPGGSPGVPGEYQEQRWYLTPLSFAAALLESGFLRKDRLAFGSCIASITYWDKLVIW